MEIFGHSQGTMQLNVFGELQTIRTSPWTCSTWTSLWWRCGTRGTKTKTVLAATLLNGLPLLSSIYTEIYHHLWEVTLRTLRQSPARDSDMITTLAWTLTYQTCAVHCSTVLSQLVLRVTVSRLTIEPHVGHCLRTCIATGGSTNHFYYQASLAQTYQFSSECIQLFRWFYHKASRIAKTLIRQLEFNGITPMSMLTSRIKVVAAKVNNAYLFIHIDVAVTL